MSFIIQALGFIGSGIWWLVQTFFPFLIKKFGLVAVKTAIQKSISALVVLITVSFFGLIIIFISQIYTRFREVISIMNEPSSHLSGVSADYFSCFLNLMHVSGIADGFNSAFSFGMSVLIFFMLKALYSITLKTAKTISDEVSKSLKLV